MGRFECGLLVALVTSNAFESRALCVWVDAMRAEPRCGSNCFVVVEHEAIDAGTGFPRFVRQGFDSVAAEVLRTPPTLRRAASVTLHAQQPLAPGVWNLMWDNQGSPATPIYVVGALNPPPPIELASASPVTTECEDSGCGPGIKSPYPGVWITLNTSSDGGFSFRGNHRYDVWLLPPGAELPTITPTGDVSPPPLAEQVFMGGSPSSEVSTIGIDNHPSLDPGDRYKLVVRMVLDDGQASPLAAMDFVVPDYRRSSGCAGSSPGGLTLFLVMWVLYRRRIRRVNAD